MNSKSLSNMKIIIILILLAFIVRTLGDIFTRLNPEPQIRYEYKTDTIRVPRISPIHNPRKDEVLTMPRYQYYYKEVDNTDTITIREMRDSLMLVINGLSSDLWISKQFLRRYPKAGKLVSLDLTRDTLILNQLGTNGLVKGEEYPIYLSQYDYYYSNNKLVRSPTKAPLKTTDLRNMRRFNGYVGMGSSLFAKEPMATFGLELPVRRFSLQLESRLGLLEYDNNSLELTLKYRLWQK